MDNTTSTSFVCKKSLTSQSELGSFNDQWSDGFEFLSKVAASLQAQLSGNEATGMMGEGKMPLDAMLENQMQID